MEVKTSKFLWNASKLVTRRPVLQSYYLSKCRSLLQEGEDGHLPGNEFRKSAMCNLCSNVFMYGRYHISVMPEKVPGKKMKKIIRRQELAETLRPFEKKLYEKYKKEKDNKLVLKCLVCQKRTILPLSKPVQLKPTKIQNETVETPVTNKKKKKKKKKDIYAGLNSSVMSVYNSKRELSQLKSEKKTKKENEPVDIHSSMQPSATPQEEQSRRKSKAGKNFSDLELFPTDEQKVHKVKSTVRKQIAQAKQLIIASRKKAKRRIALELENTTKKARKCNALRKILADTSSQSARTTFKEFLANLN